MSLGVREPFKNMLLGYLGQSQVAPLIVDFLIELEELEEQGVKDMEWQHMLDVVDVVIDLQFQGIQNPSRPSAEHMTRSVSGGYPEHLQDTHPLPNKNANAQHKEALRLALGSILAPKRPYTPSRSSSGTSTPAYPHIHPYSHASTPPSSGQAPAHTGQQHASHGHHDTRSNPAAASELQAHPSPSPPHPHLVPRPHSHYPGSHYLHPPSRLARLNSAEEHSSASTPSMSCDASNPGTPHSTSHPSTPNLQPSHMDEVLPALQLHSAHSEHAPGSDPHLSGHEHGVEEAKYSSDGSGAAHPYDPRQGRGLPRAKFLETLQSKSAWEALIHGSFS
ncbi:hypothetical protein BDN72DRAFT_964217 [Pluteus cervinus]|uniref:Uncharacterized protein n=1 Tax=Pluteus cervinus TaxID=181527 RepID=A0ACD3ABR5_9AGAR|nr:hypothetical protein BDN72DRAFT_964217 [Pluteus cervinus]